MKIYIDTDFKCHVLNPDSVYAAVETDFFDGKCAEYIEGYRYIPAGESWTRPDGAVFSGEMIAPWMPWNELDKIQRYYEREQLEVVMHENYELLADLAAMVDAVYESDLERIES